MKSNLNIFINIFYIFIFFAGITSSFGQTKKYMLYLAPIHEKGYTHLSNKYGLIDFEIGNPFSEFYEFISADYCSKEYRVLELKDTDFPLGINFRTEDAIYSDPNTCYEERAPNFTIPLSASKGIMTITSLSCGNYAALYPFQVYPPSDNNLGPCSLLSSIRSGFENYVTGIYYSKNGFDNWLPFPSDLSNLTLQDIPDLDNYTGNLYVRAKFEETFQNNCYRPEQYYNFDSDIIIYSIRPCPPTLLNTSSPNYTICNDQNGEVTFTFNRPLDTDNGEKFLFNYNVIGGPTSSVNSNSTNVEMISRTVYKLKNIAADSYEFTFQTQFNNNTPSTVAPKSNFTITKTLPLKFQATPIQPLCSDGMAGITITATGGTPPYFYILDGGTPVEFTTPYEKTGLSTANHTIKVIDIKLCTEK